MRAPVLLNLLNKLQKSDKMLGKPRILSFTQLVKHEHSCNTLYLLSGGSKESSFEYH